MKIKLDGKIDYLDTIAECLYNDWCIVYLTNNEKSQSTISKIVQCYLDGIKDPSSKVKDYHGLIVDGAILKKGEKENTMADINKLIKTFEDMANRGSLLTGGDVTQNDLLIQIIGTIVLVSMNNNN